MRIVKNLLGILHRTDRQARSEQLLGGFRFGLAAEPFVDRLPEPARHILGPVRARCSTFLAHKVRPLNGLAELSPVPFSRYNEADVSIFTEKRSPWRHIGLISALEDALGQ